MNNIDTDRLTLRPLSLSDVDEVYFLRSDIEVGKFIKREKLKDTDGAILFIKRITLEVKEGKIHYWAITEKEDDKMIGSICLWNFNETKSKAEVGYDLHPNHQGKGYMNETLQRVLDFAFNTLKLSEVSAYTDHRNLSSVKLLEQNGFILNKNRRDEDNLNNRIFIADATLR